MIPLPIFLSEETFVPHQYNNLTLHNYSIEAYNKDLAWYQNIKDAEFKRIFYLSDGLKVTGFLSLPKPLEQHKKYPLILYNRGGSNDDGKITIVALKEYFYPWIKAGFIVMASQYRGNDGGQGKDRLGGSDVNDVVTLYHLAQKLPFIDPTNIFMVGFSRGAIMACGAIKAGIKVNALALHSGVTNLLQFEKDRPDTSQLLLDMIGYTPSTKEEEFLQRSPIHYVDQVKVPTLLLHGEADTIVSEKQSLHYAQALESHHIPFKLVLYPNGDHFLHNYLHDVNQTIIEWFNLYRK